MNVVVDHICLNGQKTVFELLRLSFACFFNKVENNTRSHVENAYLYVQFCSFIPLISKADLNSCKNVHAK